jgi:hypothetical protein
MENWNLFLTEENKSIWQKLNQLERLLSDAAPLIEEEDREAYQNAILLINKLKVRYLSNR